MSHPEFYIRACLMFTTVPLPHPNPSHAWGGVFQNNKKGEHWRLRRQCSPFLLF